MKILVQRSLKSNVSVDNKEVGKINFGIVAFVGFTFNDDETIINKMIDKLINLRIFNDENGVMNKSLLDINGEILSISQFTLYGDATNGRRPSYVKALNGSEAILLYDMFNKKLKEKKITVAEGIFGADMLVNINNDGPVTIMLESR